MPARPVAQGPALFPSGVVCERYRIDAVLGVGGTGTVFRAHDLVAGADVALKAIPHDAVLRQRARREVAVAGRLDHEHVVRLLDVAEDDDYVYVVSEFVDGGDLALALRGGQVGDGELLRIVGAVCDALAHAHANGVVHRDVKPANVLLASDGGVRLADFGISAISDPEATVDDRLLGTLSYMAPETCRGERPAAPADVWAVGVLLYEGLTGVNPFRARRPGELLDRQARPPRPLGEVRPDLPRGLVSACGRALSTDPRRRPSAGALRDAVDAAAELLARADDATRVVPLRPSRSGTRSRPDLASVGEAIRRAGDAVAACHLPEGRPRRALAVAERGVPALAAGVFVGAVLRTLPFWPPGWVLPLAVLCAVVALVAPWPGAALSLALIVPAVGNESAGLAWVLAGLGVAWLAVSAGSGRRALLPALAPPLVALLALPLYLILAGRMRTAAGRALAGAAGAVAVALWHAGPAALAPLHGVGDARTAAAALWAGAGAGLAAQAGVWSLAACAWPFVVAAHRRALAVAGWLAGLLALELAAPSLLHAPSPAFWPAVAAVWIAGIVLALGLPARTERA